MPMTSRAESPLRGPPNDRRQYPDGLAFELAQFFDDALIETPQPHSCLGARHHQSIRPAQVFTQQCGTRFSERLERTIRHQLERSVRAREGVTRLSAARIADLHRDNPVAVRE